MEDKQKCPKCEGEMTKGYVATPSGKAGTFWLKGSPSKLHEPIALYDKGDRINSYKCINCGFIENYV